MLSSDLQQQVHEYLSPAQSVVIFFHDHFHADVVTSVLGLYLQLQSQGKNVTLVSQKHLGERWQMLPSFESVQTEVGNKNLQISFGYQPELVDKVSYHIDEETQQFNLIIQPKKGFKPLDPKTVQFAQTGAEADLLITVGVHQLSDLGDVYAMYADLFESAPILSVNSFATDFGTIKLTTNGVSGYSELLTQILFVEFESLGSSVATNFLAGISEATQSFQSLSTTADTLETAAKLLRNGAQRISLVPEDRSSSISGNGGSGVLVSGQLGSDVAQNTNSLAEAFRQSQAKVVEPEPVEELPKKTKAKLKNEPSTLNPPAGYNPGIDSR